MKPRILVVEDEPSILDNIVYSLETEGFEPHGCATGGEAQAALQRGEFALVVLDVGLPDMLGFELCKEIRGHSNVPIIFLTARAAEIDRIVGLEIGGDDYVVKPFSPRELCARVKAVLRRVRALPAGGEQGKGSTAAGPFRIDEERAQIHFFGKRLALSGTEFRLLRALCQRPGRVYSRAQLMEIAWEDPGAALERTVDAHIKSLRAKLKEARPDVEPVETHRGFGYSLRETL
ncbi:MAG: two-component system response regulator CreB [Verrucomicrobiota bacterium]|nr:two-component system response regulator CreB [Verrucomicrobiota bacterium]